MRRVLDRHSFLAGCVAGALLAGQPLVAAEDSGDATRRTLPDLAAPFGADGGRRQMERESDASWWRLLADSAIEAGFYPIAEGFYRKALGLVDASDPAFRPMSTGLVTALIAQAKVGEAESRLEAMPGEADPPLQLRRAAISFLKRDFPALESEIERIQPETLGPADAGWYRLLRAIVLDRGGVRAQADAEFERALAGATSQAEAAVFRLAQVQARLRAGEATEGLAAQLRRLVEENQGRRIGYQFALQYAVVLETLGRSREAVAVLTRQRDLLPPEERELRDQTLLMLGLIAGAGSLEGRTAYRELLVTGSDRELQQAALLRLASGAPGESGPVVASLRGLYDELIARDPPHPLHEDLLFFRAELALRSGLFEAAERDVDTLLTLYPGTALRRNAVALLASSSWQSTRFRTAASHIEQLRSGMEPGPRRAVLTVLLGESYYRAGMQTGSRDDFRNAAEAYAAAGAEFPAAAGEEVGFGFTPGTLLFQRVLSLIRAGDTAGAARVLDEEAARGADAESRWQAEWNLARFLQLEGKNSEALARIESLGLAAGVPAELRLRFLWLAAQLSLDAGRTEETAVWVARVLAFLGGEDARGLDDGVRAEVASNAALLAAQARLEAGDTDGGMRAMDALRAGHPGSRAALYSFIVQARYLATGNQLVDAQRLLTSLADTYRQSEYAPLALYEAALQAERRGQDAFLAEANQLLERLATEYPEVRYQFPARLKQADISRRLNRFGAAEQIYQYLENAFPDHPNRAMVELSLADTLMAQAAGDLAKFEGAITRLERLAVLPAAGPDLRAEAGFKLGYGWRVQGNAERAAQLYWEVYTRFLGPGAGPAQLGTRGRYWLARTLLELGQIEEDAGRLDNARRAYEAVLAHGLPGEKLARGRLVRFQAPALD